MDRYDSGMNHGAATAGEESAEAALREELARGDAVLDSATPVMRHLLAGAQHAIFADEIVARVRGATFDVARQLLDAIAEVSTGERGGYDQAELDGIVAAVAALPGFLGHAHALAIEWQLAERLQSRLALDPTLPPLLQALLASDQPTTSALAMNLLAAQARFAQAQRRMALPLRELPADLLHGALTIARTLGQPKAAAAAAEAKIREEYDESRTRLALAARLVTEMGGGAVAALSLTHAGLAIFATAAAMASGQDRDLVLLAATEGQALRLALTLRAAGLQPGAIEEQLVALHPAEALPPEWTRVGKERAAELLAAPAARTGG